MAMNFQDVLRDVHDPVNHALQTNNGGATIFAVVNTAAAGQSSVVLDTGVNWIGLASISGNVNVGTPTVFLGTPTLNAVVNIPSSVGITGNTTVLSINTGTNKTLIPKPIAISASGNTTVFVATGIFKVTHLLLNSDATVRMTILSGVSYLVGNASVGVTISPTGGWVENGSPDSPLYLGLAADAGFVINTSATANVGGKVIYFQE